jgi:transcriptional regulator with GAF, ATPase, and Fis domain
MSRLLAIARELLSEPELDVAARLVLQRLIEVTGTARGFIITRGDEGYVDRFDVDFDRSQVSTAERRFSRALVRRAIEGRQLIYSPSVSEDERFAGVDSVAAMGQRVVLVAPLVAGDTVHGVVYLEGSRTIDAEVRRQTAELVEMIGPFMQRALAEDALRRRARTLEHDLLAQFDFQGIVTRDAKLLALLKTVVQLAEAPATVLLRGETGTGKELVARALHVNSSRRARPLSVLHCAALPPTVLESELFGHTRGAFTGAERERVGRIAAARGGTLLLDEIGELSLDVQTRLLRFLQFGEIQRLGSDQTEKVDVRVVCATHRNLVELVKEGRFRQDLYYRIHVVELVIPPLRERIGDREILIEHFLARLARGRRLSPEARAALLSYDYPGNVRELEHAIERMGLLAQGDVLGVELLPEAIAGARPSSGGHFREFTNDELHAAREAAVANIERQFLEGLLAKADGNVSAAARHAAMPRGYLQKLIARHRDK